MSSNANLVLATPPLHIDRNNCPVDLRLKHGPGLATSQERRWSLHQREASDRSGSD